jgi:hypothetical protein
MNENYRIEMSGAMIDYLLKVLEQRPLGEAVEVWAGIKGARARADEERAQADQLHASGFVGSSLPPPNGAGNQLPVIPQPTRD